MSYYSKDMEDFGYEATVIYANDHSWPDNHMSNYPKDMENLGYEATARYTNDHS